jgi:predicted AAA+ superfamily ATPase
MFMGNVYNAGMISGATDSIQALVADNGTTISFLENANASALAWGTVGTGKSMRVQVVYISA